MTSFSDSEKEALRRDKIAARNALTDRERQRYSGMIVERILGTESFRQARTVMLYRAFAGEVILDGLPGQAPEKRYVYPRCLKAGEMIALQAFDSAAWRPGPFGILEPEPERSWAVDPGEIDLVLCPCTAFDTSLRRLGMGGGYYDRYLPRCRRARVLAVAFEVQRADRVPATPQDWMVDGVVTEKGIREGSSGLFFDSLGG